MKVRIAAKLRRWSFALGVVTLLAGGIFPTAAIAASSGVIADRHPTSDWFGEAARIDKAKEKLLSLTHRPTIAEFLEIMGELPAQNPFQALDRDTKVEEITLAGPKIIAGLEYAYPGATWAILGRDSSFMGDVLEAFYLQNGAHDRVVRLNASTGSFETSGQELKFLYSAGLLSSPEAKAEKKWVILDPTSWSVDGKGSPLSQIRKLITAYYAKHGDAEAQRMVGAIGLGTSSRGALKGVEIEDEFDIESFWKQTDISSWNGPDRILYTFNDFAYLALNPVNSTEVAWHEKFGPFQDVGDGKVIATPGAQSSQRFKEHILYTLYEAVKATGTPFFRTSVENKATQYYGYDFNKTLRGELRAFESETGFARLFEREWSAGDIGQWGIERFNDLPRSMRGFKIVSKIRLAAHGFARGSIDRAQLQDFMQEGVDRAQKSGEIAQFFARILGDMFTTPGAEHVKGILLSKNWSNPDGNLLAIVDAMYELGLDGKLPKNVLRPSSTPKIKEMMKAVARAQTVEEIITLKRKALKLAVSPGDYLLILNYGVHDPSETYIKKLGQLIVERIDAVIQSGASIEDLNKLKNRTRTVEGAMAVMTAALPLVRTERDFLRLTEYMVSNPTESYSGAMSSFISDNIHYALKAGATLDTIKILKSRMTSVNAIIHVMTQALPLVKSNRDFKKLTRFGVFSPSDGYREAMATFIVRHRPSVEKALSEVAEDKPATLWGRFQATSFAKAVGLGHKPKTQPEMAELQPQPGTPALISPAKPTKTEAESNRSCPRTLLGH